MTHTEPIVLVTGASSGIGQACATHLAKRGYRVFGTSRAAPPPAAPHDAAAGLVEMLQMNVDDEDSVERGVAQVLARAGKIDVVVNCAGFGIAGAVEDTSIEEAKAQLETNLFGVWRVCRAVLPPMREQGSGIIVNVSSIGGLIGIPYQAAYSASKFALEGLSEALSAEVRPLGIRVVQIEPGDLATQFTARRRRTAASSQNPAHRERFDRALHAMEISEQQGPSPKIVARLLERIIQNPSPRLRYTVGPFTQRLAATLKKCLPDRLFEWIMMKSYGIA
ncbi:MAG: SDR family NAD(P)-dependent oxidoreductase [Anaerolineae bacterium]